MNEDDEFRRRRSNPFDKLFKDLIRKMEEDLINFEKMMSMSFQENISDLQSNHSQGKKVYGFSIKIGPDGKLKVDEFGTIPRRNYGGGVSEEASPETREEGVRQPLVDVMDRNNEIVVVAELPGVDEKDINISLKGKTSLVIEASGKNKFFKKVSLPSEVDIEKMSKKYKHGILELRLPKVK